MSNEPPRPVGGGQEAPSGLEGEPYCYLTTTGRVSGQPHEVEIWFALHDNTAYLMNGDANHAGGSADWVRNLRQQPAITLRIAGQTFDGTARVVTDATEDALARSLIREKYPPATPGDPNWWGNIALPVAIDLKA